jgi:hypothetical protein
MACVDSHLVKPLIELFSHLGVFLFLILCKNVNPGLENDVRKQCQAGYVVYLTNKPLGVARVIYINIGHYADVLQDPN